MVEREPDEAQAQALVALLQQRGYSEAELIYATQEVLFDPDTDKKLSYRGGSVSAADFERHVKRIRTLRAKLDMPLRLDDVNNLIADYPNHLAWTDFGICDYTVANTPLYRYSFNGTVKDRAAQPMISANERPGSERTGKGGTYSLGELL